MSTFFGGTGPVDRDQSGQPLDYGSTAGSGAIVSFFNAVYAWMAAGLALTAVVAWWVSTRPDVMRHVFNGGAFIFLFIAQIVLVGVISGATRRLSASAATGLFLVYAALNGLTLSGIFLIYTTASVAGAFIACAAMFGAMSLFGAMTKTDLSGLGRILFMALIGLIIATVVNFFMMSSGLSWIISYAGVVIFAGLTARDTQALRGFAIATAGDSNVAARFAVNGALMLYLDFLNLFLFLLQILGDRRR